MAKCPQPRPLAWLIVLLLFGAGAGACMPGASNGGAEVDAAPPLAALPPPASATSDLFTTSEVCGQCHLAKDGPTLRDPAGRDVSPLSLWRSSMMALAARDPFYLAVFEEELAANPGATAAIETTCTPCHAPQGHFERREDGGRLTFADLTAGDSDEARLGRDGVACAFCHQIADRRLGESSSFTGGYVVEYGRRIYGPHGGPNTEPMEFFLSYTPAYAAHVLRSALCATCHTVITRRLDASGKPTGSEFVEQAPYLEWRNSDFNDEAGRPQARACQGCHVPTTDEDGADLETRLAVTTASTLPRKPFGRHVFVGGNAWMLRLFGANADWAGHGLAPAELEAAAQRSEAHLREAATVAISAARQGQTLVADVDLTNRTGHKFPTGYPGRRAWLHVTVTAGDQVVFESGAVDAEGHLVDAAGAPLDGTPLPHRDEITRADQVAVYEALSVDDDGDPTHLALASARFGKDDRVLPAGWSATHADAARTRPVGVEDDSDFVAGGDRVTYRITLPATASGPLRVNAEILYQSVPPTAVAALAKGRTASASRFVALARSTPVTTAVVATAQADVP